MLSLSVKFHLATRIFKNLVEIPRYTESETDLVSIIAFKTLTIRIRPLRGPCGSIDQYFVHHHLAMQSLLKVKAEDTGYHSLRRFTGR